MDNCFAGFSVAARGVVDIGQGLAAFVGGDQPGGVAGALAAVGDGGAVGRDDDAGVGPERRLGRQGFGVEHIEHGLVQVAVVEGIEQILRDQVGAAAGVDEAGAARQLGVAKSTLYLKLKRYGLEPDRQRVRSPA